MTPGTLNADSIGFLQAGTGAVAQLLQEKERQIVNAADYGTKLATTPAADINLAITYANSLTNGGVVVVKPGSYTVETPILHKSNVELVLSGVVLTAATGLNATVIKNATAITEKTITGITNAGRVATATCVAHGYVVGDWVHISGASPDGYNGWHKVITAPTADTFTFYVDKNIAADSGTVKVFKAVESNLRITGGKIIGNAANTAGDNDGVYYHGVRDYTIDDLVVDGTYNNAIVVLSGALGRITRCRTDNVIHAQHNGICLGGSSPTNTYADDVEVVACTASGNGQDGILAERGKGVRIIASGGMYNGLCAIKIAKASDVEALGCWGKYNTANGLQIQASGGNGDITVGHCAFIENGESGIFVNNLDATNPLTNVSLLGNQCHRNGQLASSTSYGIAIELTAACTLDGMIANGNNCTNQGRGISFSSNGTVSHAIVLGNICRNNTADTNYGTSLETATATLGPNDGASGSSMFFDAAPAAHRLHFWADNIAAGAAVTNLSDGLSGRGYLMPRAGYVKCQSSHSSAAVTAGSATFSPRKNGSNFTSSVTHDATAASYAQRDETPQQQTFAAGDMITCIYTSTAGLLPAGTNDFDVVVEVVYT